MLRFLISVLCLPAILGFRQPSFAQEIYLSGQRINFVVPKGYCLAGESGDEAAVFERISKLMAPNNKLLVLYINCNELSLVRSGKAGYSNGFYDFVGISTAQANGTPARSNSMSRAEFIQAFSQKLGNKDEIHQSLRRAEEKLRKLNQNHQGTKYLGPLAIDENAIYLAFEQMEAAADGHPSVRSLNVAGITFIRGFQISVTMTRIYKKASDLQEMLNQQRIVLASLVSVNR